MIKLLLNKQPLYNVTEGVGYILTCLTPAEVNIIEMKSLLKRWRGLYNYCNECMWQLFTKILAGSCFAIGNIPYQVKTEFLVETSKHEVEISLKFTKIGTRRMSCDIIVKLKEMDQNNDRVLELTSMLFVRGVTDNKKNWIIFTFSFFYKFLHKTSNNHSAQAPFISNNSFTNINISINSCEVQKGD